MLALVLVPRVAFALVPEDSLQRAIAHGKLGAVNGIGIQVAAALPAFQGVPPTAQGTRPIVTPGSASAMALPKASPGPTPSMRGLS